MRALHTPTHRVRYRVDPRGLSSHIDESSIKAQDKRVCFNFQATKNWMNQNQNQNQGLLKYLAQII